MTVYSSHKPLHMSTRRWKQILARRHLVNVRNELAAWQNDRCFYCAEEFGDGQRLLTYDHIHLSSEGGEVSIKNGVAACKQCNWLRNDIPFHQFCADFGIDPNNRRGRVAQLQAM